jgi:hypothetical protein
MSVVAKGQDLPPALQKNADLGLKARHSAPAAIGYLYCGSEA